MKTYEDVLCTTGTNSKKATCKNCKVTIDKNQGVVQKSNSGNYFYICMDCNNNLYTYSTQNTLEKGKAKKLNITVSFEFESMTRNNQLIDYNFIATSDATVDVEWKTPIYNGLSCLPKMFTSMENDNLIYTDDDRVGSHSNVGYLNDIGYRKMDILRNYDNYIAVFKPLYDYMTENKDDTIKLFGRTFCYYAQNINTIRNGRLTRELFINVRKDTHIENRLSVFRTKKQYMQVVKFNVDMLKCIENNLFQYMYEDKEVFNHKMKVTSKKLVSLFKKHVNALNG